MTSCGSRKRELVFKEQNEELEGNRRKLEEEHAEITKTLESKVRTNNWLREDREKLVAELGETRDAIRLNAELTATKVQ